MHTCRHKQREKKEDRAKSAPLLNQQMFAVELPVFHQSETSPVPARFVTVCTARTLTAVTRCKEHRTLPSQNLEEANICGDLEKAGRSKNIGKRKNNMIPMQDLEGSDLNQTNNRSWNSAYQKKFILKLGLTHLPEQMARSSAENR